MHSPSTSRATGPTLQQKETARELFREGDEKYRQGDYDGALKAFAAADDIMKLPTTGLERGRTLMMLKRLLEASEVLGRVTRIARKADELEAQQQARNEAQRLIDEARARIPSLRVTVQGVPEQVAVRMTVDDVEVPASAQDFPQKLNPGPHVVRITAPGFHPEERDVSLGEGAKEELEIMMRPTGDGDTTVDPWAGGQPPDGDTGDAGVNPYTVMIIAGFGVGAVGFVTGAITGAITLQRVDELKIPLRQRRKHRVLTGRAGADQRGRRGDRCRAPQRVGDAFRCVDVGLCDRRRWRGGRGDRHRVVGARSGRIR